MYLWAGHFKFKVIARKELEAHLAQVRLTAHEQSQGAPANGSASTSFITSASPRPLMLTLVLHGGVVALTALLLC